MQVLVIDHVGGMTVVRNRDADYGHSLRLEKNFQIHLLTLIPEGFVKSIVFMFIYEKNYYGIAVKLSIRF